MANNGLDLKKYKQNKKENLKIIICHEVVNNYGRKKYTVS